MYWVVRLWETPKTWWCSFKIFRSRIRVCRSAPPAASRRQPNGRWHSTFWNLCRHPDHYRGDVKLIQTTYVEQDHLRQHWRTPHTCTVRGEYAEYPVAAPLPRPPHLNPALQRWKCQPLWLRRCRWSPQLGLTFSNDLSEHGPGTPTARARSATVLHHTPALALLTRRVLGSPARRFVTRAAVRCRATRSASSRSRAAHLHQRLQPASSRCSSWRVADSDQVCAGASPAQLPACTCNPLTAALRFTRCCTDPRGQPASSPSSAPRSRASPRRSAARSSPRSCRSRSTRCYRVVLPAAARRRKAARRRPRQLWRRRSAAAIIWRLGRAAHASLAALAATRGSLARLACLRRVYVKKCWRRCVFSRVVCTSVRVPCAFLMLPTPLCTRVCVV